MSIFYYSCTLRRPCSRANRLFRRSVEKNIVRCFSALHTFSHIFYPHTSYMYCIPVQIYCTAVYRTCTWYQLRSTACMYCCTGIDMRARRLHAGSFLFSETPLKIYRVPLKSLVTIHSRSSISDTSTIDVAAHLGS